MELGKTNFQSKVSANKRVSKTDKIETTCAKETNNKPAPKPNEAARKPWHVLRGERFKNSGR
ncbi:hypothetical protein C1S83_24835 [Vibrio parahaemolyticus]|nr:hypothetical protein C1S87_24520 [Vibrio parahaemolyticus]PMT83931.1 hypothetical protein C1S83_24835 [Vibrio parahaemolyticus]PMT85470.1 hypothetical protein C1T03_24865 [Vibrio parahaemolyticus]